MITCNTVDIQRLNILEVITLEKKVTQGQKWAKDVTRQLIKGEYIFPLSLCKDGQGHSSSRKYKLK